MEHFLSPRLGKHGEKKKMDFNTKHILSTEFGKKNIDVREKKSYGDGGTDAKKGLSNKAYRKGGVFFYYSL